MSPVFVAAVAVEPVVLLERGHARAVPRRLRHVVEHIRDARALPRMRSSVAMDVVSPLRGVVSSRGLVRLEDLTPHREPPFRPPFRIGS